MNDEPNILTIVTKNGIAIATLTERLNNEINWGKRTFDSFQSHLNNSEEWKAKICKSIKDLEGKILSNTDVNKTENAVKEYKKGLKANIRFWLYIISAVLGIPFLVYKFKVLGIF